ncbi:MAG: hypothetical protein GF368_03975 [Candidatus Aenigmarchaeota archaeon]|nr:hypothetical protein [Candidatus Aenigmarchaeota archaeon]
MGKGKTRVRDLLDTFSRLGITIPRELHWCYLSPQDVEQLGRLEVYDEGTIDFDALEGYQRLFKDPKTGYLYSSGNGHFLGPQSFEISLFPFHIGRTRSYDPLITRVRILGDGTIESYY